MQYFPSKIISMVKVTSALFVIFILTFFQACKSTSKLGILKFNLQLGKEYELQTDWNIIQKVENDTSSITMNNIYFLKVLSEQDSTITLQVTFGDMRNKMNVGDININSDTRTPYIDSNGNNQELPLVMNHVFTGVNGKSFEMQVTPADQVLSVTGLELCHR